MIVSKVPYRVSFFGGGTDYPSWFTENEGSFISATIDKFCFIRIRELPPFFSYKHRLVWSKVETVNEISEIQHPAIREVLNLYNPDRGLEIFHYGDLPARTGLGSSSSFVIGLILSLDSFFNEKKLSPENLSKKAIQIEREVLNEKGGIQDQIAISHGGINYVSISKNSDYIVKRFDKKNSIIQEIQNSLYLVYSGISRISSEQSEHFESNFKINSSILQEMQNICNEVNDHFDNNKMTVKLFSDYINESWKLKKTLITSEHMKLVLEIEDYLIKSGATSVKLLGAGGGGFMLTTVPKDSQDFFKQQTSKMIVTKISFYHGLPSITLDRI